MANQVVARPVTAICGESRRDGVVRIVEFDSRERMRRALKTGAVCLAVLVVVACIPGAHFVLVPTMILLTPFLVRRTWKVPSTIEALEVTCARCQGELTRVTSRERYPIFENCTACRRENRIVENPVTSSTNP